MNAILTFHSVDDSGSPISMPVGAFDAHLRWLTSGRVRPQSLADVQRPLDRDHHAVALTFDDGFVNSKRPIERLLDAGIRPTLFVVTGHVGKTNAWGGRDQPGIPTLPLMSWDDLGRLAERGLNVEAHSRTHPHLSRLSAPQLDDELGGCSEDLRIHLGLTSTCFAYPYGDVDSRVASRAANWFSSAVTTDMRALDVSSQPMLLPRFDMYYFRGAHDLHSWGSLSFRVRLRSIVLRRRLRAALSGGSMRRRALT